MGFKSKLLKVTLFVVIVTVLPGLPPYPTFPFAAFRVTPPRDLEGVLAPNQLLNNAELWLENQLVAPETILVRGNTTYASVAGGKVLEITKNDQVRVVAKFGVECKGSYDERVCGRPLGLAFDTQGNNLIVMEPYFGIYQVQIKTGEKKLLVSLDEVIEGGKVSRKPGIPNGLAVARNGDLYWSDMSSDFRFEDALQAMLLNPSGRLLHYSRSTGKNRVLIDEVYGANGVALSKDESFVLVAELGGQLIRRYYLKGAKAGTDDIFIDGLPGSIDNLVGDETGLWAAVVIAADKQNPSLLAMLAPFPNVRKFLVRMMSIAEVPFDYLYQHTGSHLALRVSHYIGATILLKQRRSTCSCSNISIMQLFHEMKQKYPTVPDHVVSDLVTANCHNRPACIDSLEKAVLGTPTTGQAYPSQSIHSTSLKRRINERKLNKLESSLSGGSSGSSSRESSVDKGSRCMGDSTGSSVNNFVAANNSINNNSRIPNTTTTIGSGSTGDLSRDGVSVNNTADNHPMGTVFDNNNNRIAPSRPTTLPFSGPRPTRVAPLPPISSSQTANPELGETINVQLNVTVSPVASRSPIGQRHTSTLQLQPEPPYARELAQASSRFNTPTGPLPPGVNSRSSTSVNLTLRQPSEGPQSPIHIHASPLKYTAKGFNAQSGIQSKLEITFRDGFGSISAMRTHVPGYDQPTDGSSSNNSSNNSTSIPQYGQLQENPYRDYQQQQQQQQMTAGVNVNAGAQVAATNNESDGLTKEQLRQNYLTEVAITHQIDQKNRLSLEVERFRQQLKLLNREIGVLQQPLSPQIAENLCREVQGLLEEAAQMQKEVDSAELMGPNQATANSGISDGLHGLNIEGSPVPPGGSIANRPPRPPRPPPPRMPPGLHQQPPPGAVAAAVTAASPFTMESRSLGHSMSAPAAGSNDPSGGSGGGGGDTSTGEQWTCSLCTFQNHELMTTCEVCSLPKVSGRLSSQNSAPAPSPSSLPPPTPPSSSLSPSSPRPSAVAAMATASAPLLAASAPVAATVLLQSSSASSSSSAVSSVASTPIAQPSIQNAPYQKSSIEC